jgi:undecaprenyl-diphosphatase
MDFYLFHFLNQWASQWLCLDTLAIFLAKYLGGLLILLLLAWLSWDLVFRKEKYQRTIKVIGLSLGAALFGRFIIVEIVRWLYFRPRPFVAEQVNQLVEHSASGSFPSGHAAFFFALSTVIYLYNKKAGWAFFAASFLIGLSRVFVGIHYPLDILAAALIGIFLGWLTSRFFFRIQKRKISQVGKTI